MNVTGIVTEYNPFHYGHELHLSQSQKITNADIIICVMSGNFMQRGTPAIIDKWKRTEMALKAGVDLVLELPTIYSISSAEFFAFGSISLLNSLNIVNNICFGSESGDIKLIKEISKILVEEPLLFKNLLKSNLNNGLPFAKSRCNALLTYIKNSNINLKNIDTIESFLNSSNNILAIEYCKSLIKLNSNITPYTIKREGSNYNDLDLPVHTLASASAIRNNIYIEKNLESCKNFMPKYSFDILFNSTYPDLNKMFQLIKYTLITNPTILNEIPECSEGLDNKILNNLSSAKSLNELIMLCKSKRYTYTRISRVLCQCYLGITKDILNLRSTEPTYTRVLGLNSKGAIALKEIKKKSNLQIVNKISKSSLNDMLNFDIKSTNLYSLINSSISFNNDFKQSPIIFKI
ncbi:nucleotidyltransferase [Clostridium tarantellae]|uniref:tRNA(Met) cytidine acetate ligase n=1 Tax=Clostridium tarantellae TaxID=39493 RepID=A0A6I1MPV3_9CLOT|nr:nucleotidyltransferase [Clostridium tarantellae]MPQ44167.1 nucleotidyltransferase [Clostridium tarantellae]